jgi:hypothetical protein
MDIICELLIRRHIAGSRILPVCSLLCLCIPAVAMIPNASLASKTGILPNVPLFGYIQHFFRAYGNLYA